MSTHEALKGLNQLDAPISGFLPEIVVQYPYFLQICMYTGGELVNIGQTCLWKLFRSFKKIPLPLADRRPRILFAGISVEHENIRRGQYDRDQGASGRHIVFNHITRIVFNRPRIDVGALAVAQLCFPGKRGTVFAHYSAFRNNYSVFPFCEGDFFSRNGVVGREYGEALFVLQFICIGNGVGVMIPGRGISYYVTVFNKA